VIVHTGQHYDDEMSRVFFEELAIPAPDRQLGVGSAPPAEQTGRMLAALGPALDELRPDLVMVYGDTNSTLAGALAGAQARVPVAHVEAGMRSFDRAMPEELNRVLTDHASALLLCSTDTAVQNLAAEGIDGRHPTAEAIPSGVHLVGDVMADIALAMAPVARERSTAIAGHGVGPGGYLLVTAHRAGNVDDPERLARLVDLLLALPLPVVFPVHPRTRARLAATGLLSRLETGGNVRVVPPLGYLDLLALAASARAVLTDSGGLQKEALLLGVQCVTLRDTTEWVETLDGGWNTLVDLDAGAARAALERGRPTGEPPDLYGGGHAAERIRDLLSARG
jgi:UDP-GlcNAc3NAcA epimerase